MEIERISDEPYDALFIDAAKGQYKRFFEKYSPTVSSGGVIYCDNMFMHGMVLREDIELPRRKRSMVRNLKEFTSWVMNHPDYDTSLTSGRRRDFNCNKKINDSYINVS